jgi:spore germination protein YaaH
MQESRNIMCEKIILKIITYTERLPSGTHQPAASQNVTRRQRSRKKSQITKNHGEKESRI